MGNWVITRPRQLSQIVPRRRVHSSFCQRRKSLARPSPIFVAASFQEGLKVVLAQGYCGARVRDIVRAAGEPQGSFTNHFTSKEAFAQDVWALYFAIVRGNVEKTLRNDSLPPFRRLKAWFDLQIAFLKKAEFRNGCCLNTSPKNAITSGQRYTAVIPPSMIRSTPVM